MFVVRDIGELSLPEVQSLCQHTHSKKEGFLEMYIRVCHTARIEYDKDDFVCDVITYKNRVGNLLCWGVLQDLLYRFQTYLELGIFTPVERRGNGYATKLLEYISERYKNKKISTWPGVGEDNAYLYQKFNKPPFYALERVYRDKSYINKKFDFNVREE
jgi:GNAT superfamily N-acetyltransferase